MKSDRDGAPQAPSLELGIRNLGPISAGSIRLAPLTVFVGPNNSGKSYAAQLVHSVLSAEGQSLGMQAAMNRNRYLTELDGRVGREIEGIIGNGRRSGFLVPAALTKRIAAHIVGHAFGEALGGIISANFGAGAGELVATGSKSAEIAVRGMARYSVRIGRGLSVRHGAWAGPRYRVALPGSPMEYTPGEKGGDVTIEVPDGLAGRKRQRRFILGSLSESITGDIFGGQPRDSFYLPAARSGILLGYRAIAAGIMQHSQYRAQEVMPRLTGVTSDFVSHIITIGPGQGSFYKLACDMEGEILGGSVYVAHSDHVPEIMYKTRNTSIPLHRTSSTVSEIAPVLLYLKHVVSPGSLLVIEEPESHLHPAGQRILARYVTRMIREGLYVLLTTHSSILLEEIGKYMVSSRLDPGERRSLGWDGSDYLGFDEVAPYVFVRAGKTRHRIRPIIKDAEYGIPQDEFLRVIEDLYDESIKLQEIMDRK